MKPLEQILSVALAILVGFFYFESLLPLPQFIFAMRFDTVGAKVTDTVFNEVLAQSIRLGCEAARGRSELPTSIWNECRK